MTNEERAAKLITIRGLLAKAEATDFPEEARLYTEKAQDLMTKYALTEHELREFDDPAVRDEVVTRDIKVFAPHTIAKGTLFSAVAGSNGCRIVYGASDIKYERGEEYTRSDGSIDHNYVDLAPKDRYRILHVTGFSRDIDNAEMLYTSLLVQSTKEMQIARPDYISPRTFNKSFLLGYASEIGDRLATRRRAVAKDTVVIHDGEEHNLLPVLANRDAQVKTAYEQTYKGVRLGKTNIGRTSSNGFVQGRQAGTRANVGDPGIGGRKALGR